MNTSGNPVTLNTWHHVAAVINSGVTNGTTIYVDGNAVGTGTMTLASNSTAPLIIGSSTETGNFFEGLLDEAAIFNYALNSTQLAALRDTSGGGNTPADISSLNPVGWWRMGDAENGSGSTITDQGSSGNDGTINGAIFSNDVPFNYYSVEFDGTDDYVDTGSTFQSTFRGGFTYSFWMKFNTIDGSSVVPLGSWDDNADINAFSIGGPSIPQLSLSYNIEMGTPRLTLTGTPTGGWNTSDWVHISASVQQDSSNVAGKLYINGILKSSVSVAGTLNSFTSSRSIYIGARNRTNGSNAYFPGLIDEVAIFGSALSDGGVSTGQTAGGDIATLYNSGLPADLSSLSPVMWYRMGDNESGTGTTITDQGSGGNDGTINGATFSTDTPSI
jgi:hypothetical protein